MNRRSYWWQRHFIFGGAWLAFGAILLNGGCGGAVTTDAGSSGNGDNVFLNDALSFEGSVSGKVVTTNSTRESTQSESATQEIPVDFDTDNALVRFFDVVGEPLEDPNGQPIEPVKLERDGSFATDNLPVGVDFTVCIDIGSDGTCDIETCINIPADGSGMTGTLTGVEADPLTTLILAKLRRLINERGLDPRDLPISPVAVATRIVNAYTHLFEEAGIDQSLNFDDIRDRIATDLATLFDTVIPSLVRTGMRIVEGNLQVAGSQDVENVALGAAEVFLNAGFPIADDEGGIVLTGLAALDDVEFISFEEFDRNRQNQDDLHAPPSPDELTGENILEPAATDVPDGEGYLYYSTVAEPNRNFAGFNGEPETPDDVPPLPIIGDHILVEMAQLHLEGRRIRLSDVYDVLVSLDSGLGARLTYFINDPNFFGPPLDVFETADGRGKALSLDRILNRFFSEGIEDVGPHNFDRVKAQIHRILTELLGDTIPPTFDRLFGGFANGRVDSIESLAMRIRDARAHLPFSRSGPSSFYVVADGDPFISAGDVAAVTVDAEVSVDGDVTSLAYNPDGTGRFYLGFTESTEERGIVELLIRETGRFLHGRRGPVRLSMANQSVFLPINGQPFFDYVSDSGTFFPGTSVTVIKNEFVPEGGRFEDRSPDRGVDGPNEQLFVLATSPGPDAEPVRVDYNPTTGQATFNPNGRHLLMFVEDSHETGLFALFNESTGRPAGERDPMDFFEGPPPLPEDFEDFFNGVDDFGDFEDLGEFDDFDEFVEDAIDDFFGRDDIPDDEIVDDGNMDGEPVDGDMMPGDEDMPVDDELVDGDEMNDDAMQDEPIDPAQVADDEGDELVDEVGDEPVDEIDDGEEPIDDDIIDEPINEAPLPPSDFILINAREVIGLNLDRQSFVHVFGTDVPNERYDPEGDPFYDDINENGVHDEDEPTSPFRPALFDVRDWRSTDIRLFYRRADNNEAVLFENVDFESDTPRTLDGVALVPRLFKPRLNAFRFSRPNAAINLLTAFTPPEFFNGTQTLDRDTAVDVFTSFALINLVMDQVFNIEADVDLDGLGPEPRRRTLIDAHLFVVPIGDPLHLLLDGFRSRAFRDGEETPQPEM